MFDKLNEIKIKVNNIYNGNIEIIKEEINIFINTYIKNEIKRNEYINELKYISLTPTAYELDDEYYNPGGGERNRNYAIRGFNKGKKELENLLIKIELFLESDINSESKKEKFLISAGTHIQAGGDIIVGNGNKNIQDSKNVRNWQNNILLYIIIGIIIAVIAGLILNKILG